MDAAVPDLDASRAIEDAGIDARAPDARAPDAAPGSVRDECAGLLLEGVCWYLGADGDSCTQTCAARGGFDPAALGWVGTATQGGSLESCSLLLDALLGTAGAVSNGFRDDGAGVGCHVFADGARWWLDSTPSFSASAALPGVRIACGCAR